MPRLTNLPAGCAYHPRCERVSDTCRTARPDLGATGQTIAACFHPLTVEPEAGR
jgi:peptide/nickel transport system ATP-binding protein